jgi:hypothetical protein
MDKDLKIKHLEAALDFLNQAIANVGTDNRLVAEAFEAQGEPAPELMDVFVASFIRLGLATPE